VVLDGGLGVGGGFEANFGCAAWMKNAKLRQGGNQKLRASGGEEGDGGC
jgi:hypothetical protein